MSTIGRHMLHAPYSVQLMQTVLEPFLCIWRFKLCQFWWPRQRSGLRCPVWQSGLTDLWEKKQATNRTTAKIKTNRNEEYKCLNVYLQSCNLTLSQPHGLYCLGAREPSRAKEISLLTNTTNNLHFIHYSQILSSWLQNLFCLVQTIFHCQQQLDSGFGRDSSTGLWNLLLTILREMEENQELSESPAIKVGMTLVLESCVGHLYQSCTDNCITWCRNDLCTSLDLGWWWSWHPRVPSILAQHWVKWWHLAPSATKLLVWVPMHSAWCEHILGALPPRKEEPITLWKLFSYLQKPAFPMTQGRTLAVFDPFIFSKNVKTKEA